MTMMTKNPIAFAKQMDDFMTSVNGRLDELTNRLTPAMVTLEATAEPLKPFEDLAGKLDLAIEKLDAVLAGLERIEASRTQKPTEPAKAVTSAEAAIPKGEPAKAIPKKG